MILLLTTFPSQKEARRLAKLLLEKKLAACISLSAAMESHYVWKGRRERAREYLCWIKTRKGLRRKLEQFLCRRHPYEVPEIAVFEPSHVPASYRKWVYQNTISRPI
jgi:periplasmic divalent cation tolerance protein